MVETALKNDVLPFVKPTLQANQSRYDGQDTQICTVQSQNKTTNHLQIISNQKNTLTLSRIKLKHETVFSDIKKSKPRQAMCKLCFATYNHRSSLGRHMKSKHSTIKVESELDQEQQKGSFEKSKSTTETNETSPETKGNIVIDKSLQNYLTSVDSPEVPFIPQIENTIHNIPKENPERLPNDSMSNTEFEESNNIYNNSTELTYNVNKSGSLKQNNPQTASNSESCNFKAKVTEVLTQTNLNLPEDVAIKNNISTSQLVCITDKSASNYSPNDALDNSMHQFSNYLYNIRASNSLKDKEVVQNQMHDAEKVLQIKADTNSLKSSPDAKKIKVEPITDIKVEPSANLRKILFCNICHKSFVLMAYLNRHMKRVHTTGVTELNKHIKTENTPKVKAERTLHKCAQCAKTFVDRPYMLKHVNAVHTNLKPFTCSFCPRVLVTMSHKRAHENEVHLELYKYSCKICNKGFKRSTQLGRHDDSVHKGLKTFFCDRCPIAMSYKKNLQKHIDSVHLKIRRYSCSLCDKKFFEKFQLESHFVSVHEQKEQNICHICGKSMLHRETLRKHILDVHNPMKDSSCPVKAGQDSKNVDKQFKCTSCDKKFAKKTNLQIHISYLHLKRYKYPCNQCDRMYYGKRDKERHINSVHLNVKPYACPICDKRFSKKESIGKHCENIHNIPRPHSCNSCKGGNCGRKMPEQKPSEVTEVA